MMRAGAFAWPVARLLLRPLSCLLLPLGWVFMIGAAGNFFMADGFSDIGKRALASDTNFDGVVWVVMGALFFGLHLFFRRSRR